jgi:hypothetical protein
MPFLVAQFSTVIFVIALYFPHRFAGAAPGDDAGLNIPRHKKTPCRVTEDFTHQG